MCRLARQQHEHIFRCLDSKSCPYLNDINSRELSAGYIRKKVYARCLYICLGILEDVIPSRKVTQDRVFKYKSDDVS